jgi:hypothetical protein
MRSFAELNTSEKCLELLRWVCVVPAAVLAGMAPRYLASLLMPPALAQPPGMPPATVPYFQRYYLPYLVGFVMAAAFVIVGARTAPRRRVPVAIMLAGLWMLFSFIIHVLPHLGHGPQHYRHFYVAVLSATVAAANIWYSEKHKVSQT